MSRVGNLRHPNLLPLVSYNNTLDVIYRFQRNGSLLHLFQGKFENFLINCMNYIYMYSLGVILLQLLAGQGRRRRNGGGRCSMRRSPGMIMGDVSSESPTIAEVVDKIQEIVNAQQDHHRSRSIIWILISIIISEQCSTWSQTRIWCAIY